MYLKALEIQGFKSFPDKTILQFGNDITAIVGPNGSGKSNLSDAIRWVMGEQSTKALRGAKMEDVIFGGTQKRSQVGFAEASLIFDNTDRAFPIDSNEVMVTRRYYRSGESEYYINKQSARLRDINELFMDTGLGREGYSNISQGRIDEILSLKSVDRRDIFEEAAGISKYRHRKEETERRLASTEDNLLRIGDKISELELQVEPLREQAEKAKQFLQYRDTLRGLEVAVWLDNLERLSKAAREAEENYRSIAFILQQEHDALNQLYINAENLRLSLHAKDLETEQLREQISAMESGAQRFDGQIAVLQSNVDNNQQNIQRVRAELADQENRSGGIEAQIAQHDARAAQIALEMAARKERLEAAQSESERLMDSSEDLTQQVLALQTRQAQLQSELAGRTADEASIRDTLANLNERINAAREDTDQAAQRLEQTQSRLDKTRAACKQANEQVQICTNAIAGYQLRAKTRLEQRDQLQKTVRDLSVKLDTLTSRVKLFQEMERDYEGYSKAVRFLMRERSVLPNLHGPVSALIQTEDAYTVAIETALGSAMQQIVVSTEQDAKHAIQLLKAHDCGRATFLPLSTIRPRPLQEQGLQGHPGFVGIAAELVRTAPVYQNIVSNLLGKTVISQSMDTAIAMARAYQHRFRIVTLDGQVINAGGSMTGGSISQNAGILSRANELKRLKNQQFLLRQQLDKANAELTEAARGAEEVEFEITAAQEQLRQAEDEALRLQGEEKQYAVLAQAIGDARAATQRELAALSAQYDAGRQRQTQWNEQIAALTDQLHQAEAQLVGLSDGQNAATQAHSRLRERITAIQLDVAALEAEQTASQAAARQLRQLIEAMQGDRAQKTSLIDRYTQENQALSEQIAAIQAQQSEQAEKTEAKRRELRQSLQDRAAIEAQKTRTDKDAQDKSKGILDLERESARLENRKATAELEEKQLIDKLWDTYQLTPSTASSVKAEIESLAQANRSIAALKRKIGALGTPNLGAIDEFARVNERYQYLTSQRDDVLTSKRELETIIRDITGHMTEIFLAEFAKINTYFGQTFVEMFGGGKASLVLEDPDDPLACGIDIRVQPPGKQLKTITLLSGGEKAFVAIALYFAILKVRPTPFCMLDEIDAALDDRNVQRFASYLRNLCKKTQFIVITHRRGTMEEADMLYGVTMQEQGVSKILRLDLKQLETQLGIVE